MAMPELECSVDITIPHQTATNHVVVNILHLCRCCVIGTWTGQAISNAGNVLMTPENGDRPDAPNLSIAVTDGKSQDDVLVPSQALG